MQKLKTTIGGFLLITVLMIVATSSKLSDDSSAAMAYAELDPNEIQSKEHIARYNQKKQQLRTALKTYFNNAIASRKIVSAGVSIVKGDSIVVAEGFGKRSISDKTEVDSETVFRLGSLSKGFAGVLAADLVAEGKFDFNDEVSDHVPGFQFGGPVHTSKVKIAHILSHTSGTPYHSFTNLVEAGLPMEKIGARFQEVKPQNVPGAQYSYQNAMFAMSQEVIQNATRKNINTLLQNRFFTPLGMSSVSMDHNSLLASENIAQPHIRSRSGWRQIPLRDRYYNAVAAGGINASSNDMGKWMRFLLGHNPEVMPSETIQKAFKPFVSLKNYNKYYQRWPNHLNSYYAFGWRVHQFKANTPSKSMTVWHHGGSVNNYRNEIALFPEEDLGICVLLSNNSRLARNVIPELYAIVKEVYSAGMTDHSAKAIADLQYQEP